MTVEDGAPPLLPGQDELIDPVVPEKGHSDSRRWGAEAHLQRLENPELPSPIDWLGRAQSDLKQIRALAEQHP